MNPVSILLLGFAMSTDAFAAAIGKGAAMSKPRLSQALRAGAIFGVIEAITPVLGWLLGKGASRYIEAWDHWIAFGLLLVLGLHMVWNGLKPDAGEPVDEASRHGIVGLAITGLSTSIDALAVGVTLALIGANILVNALAIGAATFTMTTIGVMAGHRLGARLGKHAEALGGVVLILIGAAILFEHIA